MGVGCANPVQSRALGVGGDPLGEPEGCGESGHGGEVAGLVDEVSGVGEVEAADGEAVGRFGGGGLVCDPDE